MRHAKQPLLVVLGAVVLLLAIRAVVAAWVGTDMSPHDQRQFTQYLFVEAIADVAVLTAACGMLAWLIGRAARAERDRRRLEHLAEVALLSGGLAHEIRNHLNALSTYISLLRTSAGTRNPDLLRRVGQLERAATALDELVNDFLTFTRPVTDKMQQVDLAQLVSEVVEFLALDMEQSHVEVRVETAPGTPPVTGDRGKLRRVIINLLVNARQAMSGGGKVVVRIRPSGPHVGLDIEDTGCGIPPEEQPRVFDAFFSTKSEGTGLGLAVVKRTIEDLGGTIDLQSQPGRGTTFRVLLPIAAHYEAALRQRSRRHPARGGAEQRRAGEKAPDPPAE